MFMMTTERLVLRDFAESDLAAVHEYASDPEVVCYTPWGPNTERETRIYIHGEKEYEEAERRSRDGIPLNPKVAADLRAIGEELSVSYDLED